jgi:hypothetical protein
VVHSGGLAFATPTLYYTVDDNGHQIRTLNVNSGATEVLVTDSTGSGPVKLDASSFQVYGLGLDELDPYLYLLDQADSQNIRIIRVALP